jgi:hypothetical protein
MRLRFTRSAKRRLARKLTYNPFLRLLLFKFWFRLACLTFAGMLLFLALFLPKIWRVSAPEIMPVVKISGLDLAQAWSLKRTARRETAAGRADRAHYAWYSAVANNPTDLDALRGLLSNLLNEPAVEPGTFRAALGQSFWLLHLTRTNAADRELVAELLQKNRFHEPLISLLNPVADSLTPKEEAAYLKALFWQNRMPEFSAHWSKAGRALEDLELALYEAAYLAGWGAVEERDAGRARLQAALNNPAQRGLANRLQLIVSRKTDDLPQFEAAFEQLQNWGEDTVTDHTAYWGILRMHGRGDEARQLALACSRLPKSDRELTLLIEACAALKLPEKGRQWFRTFGPDFIRSEEVWLKYADFLAAEGDWEELRSVAVQMRAGARIPTGLIAYSYFLEGWSELERGRSLLAEAAFARMNQLWEGHPALAVAVSSALVKLGYHSPAGALLSRNEEQFQHSSDYWQALFNIASHLKDQELLLKAVSRQYELDPKNIHVINGYAAALLVNQQQPDLAIRLTVQLMAAFPNSLAARINHSFSLLLNGRTSEARAILEGIKADTLTPQEATSFHLARFQVCHTSEEYDEAWRILERIDNTHLFPNQISWLQQCRQNMPPPSQAHP